MRTRLLAVLTAAFLAVPFAAAASSPDHQCEHATGAEHKCEKS